MSLNTYYTLGRSGLRVSRLALGTMSLGTEYLGLVGYTPHVLMQSTGSIPLVQSSFKARILQAQSACKIRALFPFL
jgi:aryl-alcohol dehydrogenase-like predicted oxidoreductase